MSVMIPPHVDPATPASERRVFEALRVAAGSDTWTVLHSLGFSSSWTRQFGEIDFVVIIPGLGIVCLEVKGGGVAVSDGIWTTRDRHGETHRLSRSPYRQAQDGQWKLLEAIRRRFGMNSIESRCPIGWLAVFPDIASPPPSPEATRAEIIDRFDLERDIGHRILETPSLNNLEGRNDLVRPGASATSQILKFLRPDFDRVPTLASANWDVEERLRQLTEEQFAALDCIEDNRLCMVKGSAGTGKTMLGLESARRLAGDGQRVLVTCFNHRLGSWISEAAGAITGHPVVAGHLHGLLRDRIRNSPFAQELEEAEADGSSQDELFGRTYFELGALAITESDERFDYVIVDEVQDFRAAGLKDVIEAWTGGVLSPKILLLGDFVRQALYSPGTSSQAALEAAFGLIPTFGLSLNCRNTRNISYQTGVLSGFPAQKVSDRQPEGEAVGINFYGDEATCRSAIETIIKGLREAGMRPADVVVLGPRRLENSSLAEVRTLAGWSLRDASAASSDALAYSTIQSFKGLESQVVIVIDALGASVDDTDALLYVAMSRARLRLFVVAPEPVRDLLNQRMIAAVLASQGVST